MLDPPLTEEELARIEATYGFRFPIDLRAVLGKPPTITPYQRASLTNRLIELEAGESLVDPDSRPPENDRWMDWRGSEIETMLAAPYEGVTLCFQDSEYWLPQWGERPAALAERMQFLASAPVLIPLGGNHYIAAEPAEAGNPVFSIVGISMIVAGCDLEDYLAGGPRSAASKGAAKHIRFWSDVLYTHWSGWLDEIRRKLTLE